jgi:nucleoside 2-deoxyribosyltransferase
LARVLALVPDVMLASRVETALRNAGHEVRIASSAPDRLDDADAVVADLNGIEPEAAAALGPPVLGFLQHTDTDTRERAEGAGVDVVVPRSRMVRELPELVERLLS